MNAIDMIQAGKLSEARALLVERVKNAPADLDSRNLLFQTCSFLGEWDKAERHLDLLISQSFPTSKSTFIHYQNLVRAEKTRAEVENGTKLPEFLCEPPAFLSDFIEARQALSSGSDERYRNLLYTLDGELPVISGTVNGVPFQGLMDCNPASFWYLEAFIHDRYLWFPLSSLRELTVNQPSRLPDLLWVSASIVTWEGVTTDCYLPVLYPGTAHSGDDQVRMGRLTEWLPLTAGFHKGVGQHLWQFGDEEKGLLELRTVTFNFPVEESSS